MTVTFRSSAKQALIQRTVPSPSGYKLSVLLNVDSSDIDADNVQVVVGPKAAGPPTTTDDYDVPPARLGPLDATTTSFKSLGAGAFQMGLLYDLTGGPSAGQHVYCGVVDSSDLSPQTLKAVTDLGVATA